MSTDKDKDKISIGDSLKKLISVGVGAAFLTEEAIKNMVGDMPLSKDVISGLLQQAKSSKEDFIKSIREEVVKNLKAIDPKALVKEVLEDYDIKVTAHINFEKKNKENDKKNDKDNNNDGDQGQL